MQVAGGENKENAPTNSRMNEVELGMGFQPLDLAANGEMEDGRTLSPTSFAKHVEESSTEDNSEDATVRLPAHVHQALGERTNSQGSPTGSSSKHTKLKFSPARSHNVHNSDLVCTARKRCSSASPGAVSRFNQTSPALLSVIPEDVIINALCFLDVSDISKASTVCRTFARMCESDNLWKEFCERDHGPDLPRLVEVYSESVPQTQPLYWKRMYLSLKSYQIRLFFFTGPREGETERVKMESDEIMMGRSRKNNICILQDEMVSRTHAKLVVRKGKYHIVDLGSINGTCINNVMIEPNDERRLYMHDEVEMGNSTFRVDAMDPLEAQENDETLDSSDNADGAAADVQWVVDEEEANEVLQWLGEGHDEEEEEQGEDDEDDEDDADDGAEHAWEGPPELY